MASKRGGLGLMKSPALARALWRASPAGWRASPPVGFVRPCERSGKSRITARKPG
jgi:hypothetical protein